MVAILFPSAMHLETMMLPHPARDNDCGLWLQFPNKSNQLKRRQLGTRMLSIFKMHFGELVLNGVRAHHSTKC